MKGEKRTREKSGRVRHERKQTSPAVYLVVYNRQEESDTAAFTEEEEDVMFI